MIVNHYNTFPHGGAATAAKRIHRELKRVGVDSRFYYRMNESATALDRSFHRLEFSEGRGLWQAISKRLRKSTQRKIHQQYDHHIAGRVHEGEVFSMAELPEPTRLDWSAQFADVVHLHWISFLADYPTFFASIPDNVPIVWTLHDMNPFTGGCHYSEGCTRFKKSCGTCHQIRNSNSNDLSAATFNVKRSALRRKKLHVVTPSRWLGSLAQQSDIWPSGTSFSVIKYGLDLTELSPVSKIEARKKLGLDTDAVLIGFGAEDISNRRKGFHHLIAALKNIRTDQAFECLVFGSGQIEDERHLPKMHQLGFVNDLETQSLIYSASDIVVVPSREDNQPQVGLEAMACGTPVVAFDAGGIPEYVRNGATGLLAAVGDEKSLAMQLTRLIEQADSRIEMGQRARMMMEADFNGPTQTQRYLDLYNDLLNGIRRAA